MPSIKVRVNVSKAAVCVIVCVVVLFVCTLSGCGQSAVKPLVVQTKTIEVPRYIRAPIPPKLLRPCALIEPTMACTRDGVPDFCNDQLAQLRLDYKQALGNCDSQITALRALDAAEGKP